MSNYFIILAAGKGKRFNSNIPKQFHNHKGKPVFMHSIDKAISSNLYKEIILVINKRDKKFLKYKMSNKVKIIYGGNERSDSCFKAINFLKNKKAKNVFIHDAARPDFTIKLLEKLKDELKNNIAVVPYLKSENSVKHIQKNKIINLNKNNIYLTQTPQCFKFNILNKLIRKNKKKITDESSLYIENKKKIKFVKGEILNKKITFNSDLKISSRIFYGIGFDIHKLIKNKSLYLGGVRIPFHSGLQGHSDGDVIIHSIIDAILGALRKKDIGTLYPNNKSKFKNIRSSKMLYPIITLLKKNNFNINNLDINLICEKPKVSKYRNKIVKSLSKLININKNIINLKGKTVEKLGLIGKEQAIACESIISINKYE